MSVKVHLALVDEASAAAAELGEQPRGSIRLTAPPGLVVSLILFIAEFQERYPKVGVELSRSLVEDWSRRAWPCSVIFWRRSS